MVITDDSSSAGSLSRRNCPGTDSNGGGNVPIPAELSEAYANGDGTIFVGAGVSRGALPDWETLTGELASGIEDCPPGAKFEDVAQYFQNQNGPAVLNEKLHRLLISAQSKPTRVHLALARLPLRQVFTTNFDDLLEKAYQLQGRDSYTVLDNETLAVRPRGAVRIVKLHGDLKRPSSIVLTAQDFEEYLATHALLAAAIAHEFSTGPVLFLGYSFRDPDVRTILRQYQRLSGKFARSPFIVVHGASRPVVEDLRQRKFHVIELDGGGEEQSAALEHWIEELEREIERLSNADVVETKPLATPRSLTDDLVGRDASLAEALGLLNGHRQVAIVGPAGVGKSALAATCAAHFQRGSRLQHFVWFSGKNGRANLSEILSAVAIALDSKRVASMHGDDPSRMKVSVNVLLDLMPALLVLDGWDAVADRDIAGWLNEIPFESRVLITTRDGGKTLGLLNEAAVLRLGGLAVDDGEVLFRRDAAQSGRPISFSQSDIHKIVEGVRGNPQAIKLAAGLMRSHAVPLEELLRGIAGADSIDTIFNRLFDWSWASLAATKGPDVMLKLTALFQSATSIRYDVLLDMWEHATRALSSDQPKRGAAESAFLALEDLGLLERSSDGKRVIAHAKTQAYAAAKFRSNGQFSRIAHESAAEVYLSLVRGVIEGAGRTRPSVPYWNALVCGDMREIEPEWPMIREQMAWAARNNRALFAHYLLLLVHYMDSRLLNADRIEFVSQAIAHLAEENAIDDPDPFFVAEEALLRIDALGWTYVEEGRFEEAEQEIVAGEELAATLDPNEVRDDVPASRHDLLVLAAAWKARLRAEQGRLDDARNMIETSLSIAGLSRSWIQMRVKMAAGDIALKEGRNADALTFYEDAEAETRKYGGEGLGYQLLPRKGMALGNLGRLSQSDAAFRQARKAGFSMAQLYAEYGAALVEYQRDRYGEARQLVQAARAKLQRDAPSNLFARLLNDLYDRITAGMSPKTPLLSETKTPGSNDGSWRAPPSEQPISKSRAPRSKKQRAREGPRASRSPRKDPKVD